MGRNWEHGRLTREDAAWRTKALSSTEGLPQE